MLFHTWQVVLAVCVMVALLLAFLIVLACYLAETRDNAALRKRNERLAAELQTRRDILAEIRREALALKGEMTQPIPVIDPVDQHAMTGPAAWAAAGHPPVEKLIHTDYVVERDGSIRPGMGFQVER